MKRKLENFKIKSLLRRMGYNTLVTECEREGWKIPTSEELKSFNSEHLEVWTSDVPEDVNDIDTHGKVYNYGTRRTYLCNKNFRQNCIVLVPYLRKETLDEEQHW